MWSTSLHGHLTPGNESQCPLNRRLVEPQDWSGDFGEEKNILPLLGFELQIIQPIV